MATQAAHTFGSKCRLAPVRHAQRKNGMPPVEAQFFYSSLIPIDDPLSTTSITTSSDAKSGKSSLRPFARGDNNTLEKAWLELQSEDDQKGHRAAKRGQVQSSAVAAVEKRDLLVQALALRHWEQHRAGPRAQGMKKTPSQDSDPTAKHFLTCCSTLVPDVSEELEKIFCSLVRDAHPSLQLERIVQDVMTDLGRLRQSEYVTSSGAASDRLDEPSTSRSRAASLSQGSPATPSPIKTTQPKQHEMRSEAIQNKHHAASVREHGGRPRSTSQATNRSSRTQTPVGSPALIRSVGADDGISGQPFIRVGGGGEHSPLVSSFPRHDSPAPLEPRDDDPDRVEVLEDPNIEAVKHAEAAKAQELCTDSVEIAVGISRLHMVTLPTLQMKPIYWSPVNDIAVVTRSTWFYRDTMMPVPPAIANQLETGYHELQPWTETWSDEIRCAIDVGALGEEKVAHRLWPKHPKLRKGPHGDLPEVPEIPSDPFCAARCSSGEAAAEGSIEPRKPLDETSADLSPRPFSNYHVMYKDDREAFLVKPSLSPSAYYGRRPLVKIMKGVTIGIPVVRGFDRKKWERLHSKKQPRGEPGASAAQESHENRGSAVCEACKNEKEKGQVTDLVLVAHGIGQKFAERVESFHFTHAINGFRRAVNIEFGSPLVQQILREGQNGLMILPLNWRTGLSFEDGGPMQEEDKVKHAADGFGLKDIEPKTIPAVRSMISDVMFDIPFYMSHHKGKMIKALVAEANRVYRLWCRNNPGFAEKGRVHLIGHSLGSAMALEVLSRQPTTAPPLDLSRKKPETTFFEFDTKNLFLVGSPAGFFLLLERGNLVPRRGRQKPGADPADTVASEIVGENGKFGCLAVDNIYNLLAKEDPIAYLLNGAVDSNYASGLKVAHVPSTATSLFKSVGDAFRNVVPGIGPAPDPFSPESANRPPTFRLPSQLELEVHDFTREEIAEKKMFLLNDNGQIDWYLRSGGGPLEIQYLNMLSAHTSYWTNQDFIRMLCIEIGRKPGKKNTLPAMRAVKATKRLVA